MVFKEHTHLHERIRLALEARNDLFDPPHLTAFRLYNGFYEGYPDLVVDLYATTLLLYNYSKNPETLRNLLDDVQSYLIEKFPWVDCVLQKERSAKDAERRNGRISFGRSPADRVQEFNIWYSIDLLLNQDASFYLDTRNLRKWLLDHANGWRVLNTFAYTGSLGVAALAGGAERVVQTDRNRKFLSLARTSGMINSLDIGRMKLQKGDFFSQVAYYKRKAELFDCVILDPPFFSKTQKGTVNLVNESERLINKVRPLIKDNGWLVSINNALYLSGSAYIQSLENLCKVGYLSIEKLVSVPMDVTGYTNTIVNKPPADTEPFNHPTKIAILKVKRK